MRGLRNGDPTLNDPFLRFFEKVQESAAECNSVFFIDYGDGDVTEIGDLECETLNGWLIQEAEADAFESEWSSDSVGESYDSDFVSADWAVVDSSVKVSFTKIFGDAA